jgi:hypothetical protein
MTDPRIAIVREWLGVDNPYERADRLLAELDEHTRAEDSLRAAPLRDALLRISKSPHCSYDGPQHHCDDVRGYNIGVAGGHRCAARTAEIALDADDATVRRTLARDAIGRRGST